MSKVYYMKPLVIILIIYTSTISLFPYESKPQDKKITIKSKEEIVEIAKQYLGFPYKAGGNSPEGFDCSGFTQFVYKKLGYNLPRTTTDQYFLLEPVKIPKKGDLVFFAIYKNQVSHVGIYIGDLKFIHAPRTGKSVEIADLTNRYWKKHFVGSRRVF